MQIPVTEGHMWIQLQLVTNYSYFYHVLVELDTFF